MNLQRNPEVLTREEEGSRHLMFNRMSQLSLILNGTSYFIWDACDGTRDIAAIAQSIKQSYDTSASGLNEDELIDIVDKHLSLLQRADLLVADQAAV